MVERPQAVFLALLVLWREVPFATGWLWLVCATLQPFAGIPNDVTPWSLIRLGCCSRSGCYCFQGWPTVLGQGCAVLGWGAIVSRNGPLFSVKGVLFSVSGVLRSGQAWLVPCQGCCSRFVPAVSVPSCTLGQVYPVPQFPLDFDGGCKVAAEGGPK